MDLPTDERFDPVEEIMRQEMADAIRKLVAELDPMCRTVIRRFYLEDGSYEEIGRSEGIATNTVGSRLSRCLDKLRTLIKRVPFFQDEKRMEK